MWSGVQHMQAARNFASTKIEQAGWMKDGASHLIRGCDMTAAMAPSPFAECIQLITRRPSCRENDQIPAVTRVQMM